MAAQGERSSTDIFDELPDYYQSDPKYYGIVTPPTGTPTYTYTFSLKGVYSPLPWLRISFEPGYRIVHNAAHISGQTEKSFEFALMVSYRPRFGMPGLETLASGR
jgi:hypothetical protein